MRHVAEGLGRAMLGGFPRRTLSEAGENDTSADAVIHSVAFAVGISVGACVILFIVLVVSLCYRWHHAKSKRSLLPVKSLEIPRLQLLSPLSSDRRSGGGRVSFVRSSLKDDAALWPIEDLELEKITFGASLGRGAFGKVYRGEYAGIPLAIKVFEHDGGVLCGGDEPLETYLSRNADHPNVVKTFVNETRRYQSMTASTQESSTSSGLLSSLTDKGISSSETSDDEFSYIARAMGPGDENYRTWIVMEYCNRGSLDQAIRDRIFFVDGNGSQPNIRFMLRTALDIATAMDYLHQESIVHGDLKSQNVLLTQTSSDERGFVCKVGDFGLSRIIINKTHIETFTHGTVSHSAPELFKQGLLTPAADVYSFGIMLWELFTGRKAFLGKQHNDIILAVTRGIRPTLPRHCPAMFSHLIADCWKDKYVERPSFRTVTARLVHMIADCYTLERALNIRRGATSPSTKNEKLAALKLDCESTKLSGRSSRERSGEEDTEADDRKIGALPIATPMLGRQCSTEVLFLSSKELSISEVEAETDLSLGTHY